MDPRLDKAIDELNAIIGRSRKFRGAAADSTSQGDAKDPHQSADAVNQVTDSDAAQVSRCSPTEDQVPAAPE